MEIKGKEYQVIFDGKGILTISGKLAATPEEYEKIEDFFEKVLDSISETPKEGTGSKELVLDLRGLRFLNSSGIRTVCVSLMEADDVEGLHLKILSRKSFSWQIETIPTFKELMEDLEIVFE